MVKRILHSVEGGIEKKRCGKCETYKSLENFNNCKKTWDNLRPTCKQCLILERDKDKDKRKEYNKQYMEDNKEVQREKNKKWREENKEYIKEKMNEWLENNKEHKKQKDKEYRETHKEQHKENMRNWKRNDYKDLKTNPDRKKEFDDYKLKSNIGRRIRGLLKNGKTTKTLDYVGCTLEELKKHLESKFSEDMSWDNYGSFWHIDHIIPCDSFNFTDEFEKKACFYYKNLQPLNGSDNIRKLNKYKQEDKEVYMNMCKLVFITE